MKGSAEKLQRSVNIDEIKAILRKVEDVLSEDEMAILDGVASDYVELRRELSIKTARLQRLRKLFHIETSERLPPPANTDADGKPGPRGRRWGRSFRGQQRSAGLPTQGQTARPRSPAGS